MELLQKWRKTILACVAPILCIPALAGCSRDAPERMRSQLSMPENTIQQEEHSGVQVSAQGMIYIPFAMVDAVFLEYSDTVILPEDGSVLYTFRDEHTENTQRNIMAVYTNDVPQVRKDQTSVPGRYVVLQLERMENPNPESPGAPEPHLCRWILGGRGDHVMGDGNASRFVCCISPLWFEVER